MSFWNREKEEEDKLDRILKRLVVLEALIIDVLLELKPQILPTGVSITQGGSMITGVQAGGAPGLFEADPIPSTVPFPVGSTETWTTDDPTVTLAPSTDGTQASATVPASNVAKDFGLTVSVQMPAPVAGGAAPPPLTNTVRVPIIPAPAPVPTGVQINQLS
jgi:hypothetical protein